MKKLLFAFALLVSMTGYAQRVLPTAPTGYGVQSIRDRILKEGSMPAPASATGVPSTVGTYLVRNTPGASARATIATPGTSVGSALSWVVPPGKCWLLRRVRVSADRPLYVSGWLSQGYQSISTATKPGAFEQLHGFAGAAKDFTYENEMILGEGAEIRLNLISSELNQETPHVAGNVEAVEFTNDFNFDAKSTILVIGNSIAWGTMGLDSASAVYRGKHLFATRLSDRLAALGKDVRVSNASFGGSFAADWIKVIDAGRLSDIRPNLTLVFLGTNDATAGESGRAQYRADLLTILRYVKRLNPSGTVVFIAAPPTDSATRTGSIADYRTDTQTVANNVTLGGAANKVYYYDPTASAAGANQLVLAGTPTADAQFSSNERSSGNRIHLSGWGHLLLEAGIWSALQTQILSAVN